MGILGTINAFFVGIGKLLGYMKDRQLLDAGKDIEKGKQAENALKDISHVKKIKQDVADLDDTALDDELHNYKHKSKK